ncbi:HNH endonuclease signature motif containing protein [Microbacterium sp. NPDC078814]|uniref:HNH endonuclease n=1 Tax=Microbacterium sp. NPDC078814 TaxID=3154767 RepID=UPI00344EB764
MNDRNCTGCGINFTPTHGRQRCCSKACRKPNHRKVAKTCDACGESCEKYAGKQRYAGTYCSTLCRDYGAYGPTSCTIPLDHWARHYGRSSAWSAPVIRNTGMCGWCGESNGRHLSARFCSERCKKAQHRADRRGREHGALGSYSYAQIVKLWISFDKACAYCSERTPLADIQAEHVTPLSRGGENHIGNLLPSCGRCNSDKRDLLLNQWSADRKRRGLPPVKTTWREDDRRYRHLVLSGLSLAA